MTNQSHRCRALGIPSRVSVRFRMQCLRRSVTVAQIQERAVEDWRRGLRRPRSSQKSATRPSQLVQPAPAGWLAPLTHGRRISRLDRPASTSWPGSAASASATPRPWPRRTEPSICERLDDVLSGVKPLIGRAIAIMPIVERLCLDQPDEQAVTKRPGCLLIIRIVPWRARQPPKAIATAPRIRTAGRPDRRKTGRS